jgi:hypothetical protein
MACRAALVRQEGLWVHVLSPFCLCGRGERHIHHPTGMTGPYKCSLRKQELCVVGPPGCARGGGYLYSRRDSPPSTPVTEAVLSEANVASEPARRLAARQTEGETCHS